jgi:4-alpha-glucanotransferase
MSDQASASPVTARRASGVQLHITSLPGGRLGGPARDFVDWLAAAGQSVWQVLPVGVPDQHGSPYKSPSAFAASAALLEHPDAEVTAEEVEDFGRREAYWAGSWTAVGGDLADQVRFAREWGALRVYAAERGIRLMGDIPIYVAPQGADAQAWPQLFRHDAVAGVPPDAYAAQGQLWGNPLYDWDAVRADGYRWWVERMRRTFELFDLVRVDHFRGFSAYWSVPTWAHTALEGHWEPGPGRGVFDAVAAELGDLPVVAEDLGDIDEPVNELRRSLGFPGMAVMQFAFNPGYQLNTHDPQHHEVNQVVYTGTHDNDTVCGWWAELPDWRRHPAREACAAAGVRADIDVEPSWALIELAFAAPCGLAMTQAQDVLSLGSEARMNAPGIEGGWRWRLEPGALTDELGQRLREVTERSGRLTPSGPGRVVRQGRKALHGLAGHGPQREQVEVRRIVDEALRRRRTADEPPAGQQPHEPHDEDGDQRGHPAQDVRQLGDRVHQVVARLLDRGAGAADLPERCRDPVTDEGELLHRIAGLAHLVPEARPGVLQLPPRGGQRQGRVVDHPAGPRPDADPHEHGDVGKDLEGSSARQVSVELHAAYTPTRATLQRGRTWGPRLARPPGRRTRRVGEHAGVLRA